MKIAIISDIHEDVESLKKALSIIDKQKITKIICLGDIVGYNVTHYNFCETKNASECIKLIKENCSLVGAGNHDFYEAQKIPENNAGFNYPYNWYSLSYNEKEKISKNNVWLYENETFPSEINDEEKKYLYNLPEYIVAEIDDKNFLFSHFLYPNIVGDLLKFDFTEKNFRKHIGFVMQNNCDYSVSGHGHIEGVYLYNSFDYSFKTFGKRNFKNNIGIIIPCIARGKQRNGFVILDTNTLDIEVISLNNIL